MDKPTPKKPTASPLLPSRSGNVMTLTLNRPEARNALSESLLRALQLSLDEAVDDAAVKVIVIAAKGSVFSSGHDLKEMTSYRKQPDRGLAHYRQLFAQCSH